MFNSESLKRQENAYQRIIDEMPGSRFYKPAIYGLAGAEAALGNTEAAVKGYSRYIEESPKASNLIRAYLNIVDAYRDAGDFEAAIRASRRAQEKFLGKQEWKPSLFSEALIHLSTERPARLRTTLGQFESKGISPDYSKAGGTNEAEVRFLLSKWGDVKFEEFFNGVRDASAVYYRRRLQKSDELNAKEKPEFFPRIEPLTKSGRIAMLLELGALDRAIPLLEVELSDDYPASISDLGEERAFAFAEHYVNVGMADRAIKFVEPNRKRELKSGIDNFSIRKYRLLYPVPYRKELIESAKRHKVDPRFLLSIMRQESRFQSEVKSVAAARGLMQFIGSTSNKIANDLEIEGFEQSQLYDPRIAIEFGAKYVSDLFEMFPDQPAAVAASYNGGEDRVERWIKRSRSKDPDRYVPEVVFAQTKDYVYKVMNNYAVYRQLYDENLTPKSPNSD